ncbi:hypothetical protein [Phreatobacter stygius]|nr:hypothetical protein [Phreatobacter stygius]
MSGVAVTFSADDLRALASVYDAAAAPIPAVVGHPTTDAPAYGWATGLRYDDANERLLADLGEVEPAFAEAVGAGRYKKVSFSLFPPDHPGNPKPGAWYPKHIGFLGAAAPAVPGLKPVQFSADDRAVTFEFADASVLKDVAGLFRSLREFLIEKFGSEAADKAVPGWTIGWIDDAADRDPPRTIPAYSAPPAPEPSMTVKTPAGNSADDLARRQADLDKRERDANHKDHVAFAEGLIGDGKLLPVLKDKVVGLLDGLAPVGGAVIEVSFAEGSATKTSGALDLVKDILAAQPQVVSFGAVALGRQPGAAVDFALPSGMSADPASAELHAKAVAYQAAHPTTDYMAAIAAVQG